MFELFNFHGGLVLDAPKQHATTAQVKKSFTPSCLIYPLLQRGNTLAQPLVAVGDKVLKGQVIAKNGVPIHAASSGVVTAIEKRPIPHASGLADDCMVITTDGKDEAIATAKAISQSLSHEQLIEIIELSGVVGLGGAGFPTALKLRNAQKIDTLIINAVECEPYISCDDALIQQYAEEIYQGILLLINSLKALRCIIAIEDDKPKARQCLQQVIADHPQINLINLPNRYPSGSERQLIQLLTGKQVPSNGIPLDIGIVCLNVATVFAIQQAVFTQQPLLERMVTITGDCVREPQNRWVKIGTPIAELIAACGGYTNNAERLIMGGAMMGMALSDDAIPVVKTSNCILVSSSAALKSPEPQLPCIRCGACAEVCPAQLLPQQLYWYSRAENGQKLQEYQLAACIECGCCDVVCPSHIPLVAYFRASKSKVAFNQQQTAAAALAKQRYEARQQRLQQQQDEQIEKAKKQKLAIEAMKAKMAIKRNPLSEDKSANNLP